MHRDKATAFLRRHIARARDAGRCAQCQAPWHNGICECAGPRDPDWELDCAVAAEIAFTADLAEDDLAEGRV